MGTGWMKLLSPSAGFGKQDSSKGTGEMLSLVCRHSPWGGLPWPGLLQAGAGLGSAGASPGEAGAGRRRQRDGYASPAVGNGVGAPVQVTDGTGEDVSSRLQKRWFPPAGSGRSWRHFPAAAGDWHRPHCVSASIFSSAPG